jgi:hypothetical protein
MLRSMRVRLMLAFVAVVAVAVGIAEIVAGRTATHEFDSYVSRVDIAYLETLAQNLGDYYAANGSWQDVESVFVALPQTPGHLQLQDSSGTIVGDTSPGRGWLALRTRHHTDHACPQRSRQPRQPQRRPKRRPECHSHCQPEQPWWVWRARWHADPIRSQRFPWPQ